MKIGIVTGVRRAGALGSVAWLTLAAAMPPSSPARAGPDEPGPVQSREGGSAVPCDVPLRWRVTRVDQPFGLSLEEATALVGEAADLWNTVVDEPLFLHDPADGFPVRLVFDERQRRTNEQMRAERELEAVARSLEDERDDLARRDDTLQREREAYEEAARGYDRRLAAHNSEVARWKERGGAPVEVAERLAEAQRALTEDREALQERRRDLGEALESLTEDQRRLNDRFRRHAEGVAELERAFPTIGVESGVYREAVRRAGAAVVSVSREIRIYRFADADELRLLAAHELGHAAGLGHSPFDAAVMSSEQGQADELGVRGLHPDDVARLRQLCPALGGPR